jgi:predicted enzyme involved in methoxymalonyl-ACP biosynthesis
MRDRYTRSYRYRLTNPPKALLNAQLDNIAIVPASMLPLTQTLKEKVNTLPKGGVFLCYAAENTRQRKILERVEETFREHGHVVKSISMGEVYKTIPNF